MRRSLRGVASLACAIVTACTSRGEIASTAARPPSTRVAPVSETRHGVAIADNYRWLEGDAEGKTTTEIAAWTEAQNRYTREVLDHLPGRQALETAFRPLLKIGLVTAPIMRANRYFFAARTAAEDQSIVYWREGYLGAAKAIVDPARLDAAGLTAVAWFSPSSDGSLLAYGTTKAGTPGVTLHLIEVDSARLLPLEIPNVAQGVQWLPDGSGFFYQTIDANSRQGIFHRMASDPAADVVLFRQMTPAGNSNVPPEWGPFGILSRDGHWLVLGFRRNAGLTDLWLANFDEVRKTGRISGKVVSGGVAGDASGTVIDGTLFLHTTKGAPHGRVVAVSTADPSQARWRDIVPERADAVIEHVSFGRGRIAVTYRRNACNLVEVFDATGKSLGTLRQPGIGVASLIAEEDRTEAFLTFASFNYPATIFRVDLANPSAASILWMAPEVAVDPSAVEVEQVWYPSKDGTKISMFLAHKTGLVPAGDAPTLLLGYGAFGISMTPTFSATFFQWFEAGGLLAVPNVRGGGEYGEAWHAAGALDKKQHTFDDGIAAAEWLIANHYTNPQKLAMYGGSQGGLLVGAVVTQRPDLFRAAVARLPVLDMLRYDQWPGGRDWTAEYGSAQNADQFTWLSAYSPYQHVKAGTRYPAVLLTAVDGDPSVHAAHARKMAAALQAASASDPARQPVLLRIDPVPTDPDSFIALELRDLVDQRAFLMWQLGIGR